MSEEKLIADMLRFTLDDVRKAVAVAVREERTACVKVVFDNCPHTQPCYCSTCVVHARIEAWIEQRGEC